MTTKQKAKQLALALVGEDQNPKPLVEVLMEMADWQKQQIMKEANTYVVERHYDKRIGKYLSPDITLNEQMFKIGDKVKIIIVKED